MNTDMDPNKIARLLTISAQRLDEKTLSALRDARQKALQKQTVPSPTFAFSTNAGIFNGSTPGSFHQWIATGLLIALLIMGTSYWHHTQEEQVTELDVAILTDDLPIDVFVD